MARLIDADKLKSDYDITNWEEPYGCSFKVIDSQPTVDAEPVRRGKWIETEDDVTFDTMYKCSECGEEFMLIDGTPTQNLYNYCPNCGAKMEEEIENG